MAGPTTTEDEADVGEQSSTDTSSSSGTAGGPDDWKITGKYIQSVFINGHLVIPSAKGLELKKGDTVKLVGSKDSSILSFKGVDFTLEPGGARIDGVLNHPKTDNFSLSFTVPDMSSYIKDGGHVWLRLVAGASSAGSNKDIPTSVIYSQESEEESKEAAKKAKEAQEKAAQAQDGTPLNLGPSGMMVGAAGEVMNAIGGILSPSQILRDNNKTALQKALTSGDKKALKDAIDEAKKLGNTSALKEVLKIAKDQKNTEAIKSINEAITQSSKVTVEAKQTVETTRARVSEESSGGGGGGGASVEQTVNGSAEVQAGAEVRLQQEVSGGGSARVEGQEQATTSVSGGAAGGSVTSESTVQGGVTAGASGSATGQQEVRQETKIQGSGADTAEAEVSAKSQTSSAPASATASGSAQVTSTASGQGQASQKIEASAQQNSEVSQEPSAQQKTSAEGQTEKSAKVKTNAELVVEYDEKYRKDQEVKKIQEQKRSGQEKVKSNAPIRGSAQEAPTRSPAVIIPKAGADEGKGAAAVSVDGVTKAGGLQEPQQKSAAKINLSAEKKPAQPVKPQAPLQVSARMDGIKKEASSAEHEVLMRLRSREKQSGAQLNAKNLGRNAVELDKQRPRVKSEIGGLGEDQRQEESDEQESGIRPEQDEGVKPVSEPVLPLQLQTGGPETEKVPSGDKSFKMPEASEGGAAAAVPVAPEAAAGADTAISGKVPDTKVPGGEPGTDVEIEEEPAPTPGSKEAKKALTAGEILAAQQIANNAVNTFLNTQIAAWVWAPALPTFGLTVLLGAIVLDVLWKIKGPIIDKVLKNNPLLGAFEGLDIKDLKIEFSNSVKAQIIAMNAIVVVAIAFVFFSIGILIYIGCNWPIAYKITSNFTDRGSVIGAVYPDLCKAVMSNNFGSSDMLRGLAPGTLSAGGPLSLSADVNQKISNYSGTVDACMLKVVVQKESAGNSQIIGCDCAKNGNPQACIEPDHSNYHAGFQFNWNQCSYGIGLTQWTIFQSTYATVSSSDTRNYFKRWQDANTPSRTPDGKNFYSVQDFLNPDTSLQLTAQTLAGAYNKSQAPDPRGKVQDAFAAYVGQSSQTANLVAQRMLLYDLCKSTGP